MRHSWGFTLIELLLSIAVGSILLFGAAMYLWAVMSASVKNQTVNEVESQWLQAIQIITQYIRNAQSVNSPTPGSSTSSISLEMPDAWEDPTIFQISSDTVTMKSGTWSTFDLTNSRVTASGMSFDNLAQSWRADSIRVQFTLSHTNPESTFEYDFSKLFMDSATVLTPLP